MNKIVKKIFLAVITLLLAVVTFTGVTFAWLSINSDAWIEGMQVQATAGKGFMVSVDGTNYQNSLTQDDIMKEDVVISEDANSIILEDIEELPIENIDKLNEDSINQESISISNLDTLEDKIINDSKNIVNIDTNYKDFEEVKPSEEAIAFPAIFNF